MRRGITLGLVLSSVAAGVTIGDEVAKQGQISTIKLEHVVAGHLTDMNGKYKLRASEVTYTVGGFIGEHHHAGPGVRCVTAGELMYVQVDKTTVYRAGDCFFESGDMSHTAHNEGTVPVVLLNFRGAASKLVGCLSHTGPEEVADIAAVRGT